MPRALPSATIRAQLTLPLRFIDGYATTARVFTFDGLVDGREHLAVGLGNRAREPGSGVPLATVPLVRLHSECLTGDVLGSLRCDCGPQMREAVERIVRQHADARIVMVSSVGYQENILAALQKGAKHFVQKPVKAEVLYEILRYVLSDDPNASGAPVALAGERRA